MRKLLIAAGLVAGMLCGAQNTLDNPSFEEANPETPLAAVSWSRHLLDKHPNAYSIDSTVAQDGTRSACIEISDRSELETYTLLIQSGLQDKLTRLCPPGTDMEFSVSVRTSGKDASYRIYAEGSINTDGDTNFITAEKKNSDPSRWERLILRYKMPAEPFRSAYCCLQIMSPGKVWFDSAYLGPAAVAPFYASAEAGGNRLANAGMEKIGADGVTEHWEMLGDREAHSVGKTAHSDNASLCLSTAEAAPKELIWKQGGLADLLKDCEPGTAMALSGWISNGSNPSVKSRMWIEMMRDGKSIGTYATAEISSYFGWQQFTLHFNLPKEVPDNVYVGLQLMNNGTVYFDDLWLGLDKDAPVQMKVYVEDPSTWCRVTDFPPQQAYYWPDRPKGLSLEYALPQEANGVLQIVLKDAASDLPVKTYEVTAPGKTSLELPELGKGTYLLEYAAGREFKGFDIFRVIEPYTKGVKVLSEGRILLNGKPFFPLLICTPASGPEAYRAYELAGFNSICVSGISSPTTLSANRAAELDAYHLAYVDWCNLGDSYKGESFDKQIAFARTLKNFIGWLDDESEWRAIPIEKMRAFYKVLYTRAPEYVVWQNHAPRLSEPDGQQHSMANIRLYSHACDVTGCDIYPVPEGGGHSGLPNKTLSCVGEYTDLVMESTYGQKPIWMIIMAGAWSEEGGKPVDPQQPRPTYGQFRFQFYNAVTHGARGIVYYSYKGGLHDFYSPFMAMLADVNHEFHAIEDFYNVGQAGKLEATGDTKDVRLDARVLDGQHLVIAVNEGKQVREIGIPLPAKATFYRSPDGVAMNAVDGKLAVALKANEVLILSTKKVVVPEFKPFAKDPNVKETLTRRTDWKSAQWTAHPQLGQTPQKTTFAKHVVTLSDKPSAAWLQLATDDACTFSVNGKQVAETSGYSVATRSDVARYLAKGENTFSFEVENFSGPSGLLYLGSITDGGREIAVASGTETVFSENGKDAWGKAVQLGNPPCDPWGEVMLIDEYRVPSEGVAEVWLCPGAGVKELVREGADWPFVKQNLTGLKLYIDQIDQAPPELLASLVKLVREQGYRVAVECGGCLDFGPMDETNGEWSARLEQAKIAKWYAAGGTVDFLDLDGPIRRLLQPERPDGQRFESMAKAAGQVVEAVRAIHNAHPEIRFWHLTNFPNWGYKGGVSYHARGPQRQDYGEYDEAHRLVLGALQAAGIPLSGVTIDNPYDYLVGEHDSVNLENPTSVNWLARVRAYEDRARAEKLEVNLIVNSERGGQQSDEVFCRETLLMVDAYLAAGGRPTRWFVQTWYPHPKQMTPESAPNSMTALAKAIIEKVGARNGSQGTDTKAAP